MFSTVLIQSVTGVKHGDSLQVEHIPLCFDDDLVILYRRIPKYFVVITFPKAIQMFYNNNNVQMYIKTCYIAFNNQQRKTDYQK